MGISKKTLIEYRNDFLDYCEIEKGLSNNTQKNYDRFLGDFFKWLKIRKLDKIRPEALTAEIIWDYRVYLSRYNSVRSKKLLKKSTQNLYLIALRSLLEYFVEKNIASLPPTKVRLAKNKADREIKFLSLTQIERLLLAPDIKTSTGLRDRAILETFFSTGLRVAELVSLDREQFKINEKTKDLEIVIVGKGSKVRTVYFSERATRWINEYLKNRQDLDNALFINYWKPALKSNVSRRLTAKSIDNLVKNYVKIAGVPIMATPHTIRHSFATDLLSQGVDLRMVQEFLGHRNIATTQIYTHVTKKQLRDIHKKIHADKRFKN